MGTVSIHSPAIVHVPRPAPEAAGWAYRLFDAIEGAVLRRRARSEERARIRQANACRRLADSLRDEDPRFAADLMAAADRHEIA